MLSIVAGLVVPIPTLPLESMRIRSEAFTLKAIKLDALLYIIAPASVSVSPIRKLEVPLVLESK